MNSLKSLRAASALGAAALLFALAASAPSAWAQNGRTPQVGEKFPDFSGATVDGEPISLSDYRGKVLLVDFWATWCGPCIAELPNLKRTFGQFHDQGFEVLGISLDSRASALADFQRNPRTALEWPSIFDGRGWETQLAQEFGIRSIPATFLLDGSGTIVATNLRGGRLFNEVAKLIDPELAEADLHGMFHEWLRAESPERRAELEAEMVRVGSMLQDEANEVAWTYLDGEGEPSAEGAALCLRLLQPTINAGENFMILDTAALAAYRAGDATRAAELQAVVMAEVSRLAGRPARELASDPMGAELLVRQALYLAATDDKAGAERILNDLKANHGNSSAILQSEYFRLATEAARGE